MKPIRLSRGTIPVLCIHGFLGAPDDWKPMAIKIGTPFRIHAWALPGHGSEAVKDFDGAVRALRAVLRSFRLPPHLVGYSMGGRVALAAALQPGCGLASLTILSAQPGLDNARERERRAAADDRLADRLEHAGLSRFLEEWYGLPLFNSLRARPALRRDLLARRARGRAPALAGALRALTVGRQPSLWADLPRISVPTLFVAGALDGAYRAILRRAACAVPDSHYLVVPDAGHMPHLEHPDFLGHHIRSHLQTSEERIA